MRKVSGSRNSSSVPSSNISSAACHSCLETVNECHTASSNPWPFIRMFQNLGVGFRFPNLQSYLHFSIFAATLAMLWQLASITTCSEKKRAPRGFYKKATLGRTFLITIKTWLDQVCWSRDRFDKDHCAITRNKHTQAPPISNRGIIFPIAFLFVCRTSN